MRGFLKVIDEKTLAFPDYGGNQQYITLGNLTENDKAYLFLMDYPNQRRIKIWGHARVVENDAAMIDRLTDADDAQIPDRVVVIDVTAWDRNCPQFITPRFDTTDIDAIVNPLHARIAELEHQLAALR